MLTQDHLHQVNLDAQTMQNDSRQKKDHSRFRIVGAYCLFADSEGLADIEIDDGLISAINPINPQSDDEVVVVDGSGLVVLPGLVDLHCDAIEKIIEMRPGVKFPLDLAIPQADRQFAAAGVTTIYHSLSFATGELGLRCSDVALSIIDACLAYRAHSLVDNRLHCRYELGDPQSLAAIKKVIVEAKADLISVMDHSPGQGQFKDREAYIRFVEKNYHCSREEALERIALKEAAAVGISQRAEEVIDLAIKHGLTVASHDDDDPAVIAQRVAMGVGISEFPITLEAGRVARGHGQDVLVGAPNIIRGGSQSGSLTASEAIDQGSANCMCSDYAPQTMLPAIWRLHRELAMPLWQAALTATASPAHAAGLADRGVLAVGKRADMIMVRVPELSSSGQVYPQIQAVWSAGRLVSQWA